MKARLSDHHVNARLVTMLLYHVDNPSAHLGHIARLLKPGTQAAVAEFDPDGPCTSGRSRWLSRGILTFDEPGAQCRCRERAGDLFKTAERCCRGRLRRNVEPRVQLLAADRIGLRDLIDRHPAPHFGWVPAGWLHQLSRPRNPAGGVPALLENEVA